MTYFVAAKISCSELNGKRLQVCFFFLTNSRFLPTLIKLENQFRDTNDLLAATFDVGKTRKSFRSTKLSVFIEMA